MFWRNTSILFLLVCILAGCTTPKSQNDLELTSLETWDVIVIGDSTLWGIGEVIANHIENELGKEVNLYDFSIGNLTAVQALEAVKNSKPDTPNGKMFGWPEAIQEAEYIILHPSPAESISTSTPGDWSCMYPPYYVEDCSLATFEKYQDDLKDIVLEIKKLRDGKPVIIRFGSYWGRPGNWKSSKSSNAVDACQKCLETYSAAIEEVAQEFGIPYASFMDVLNGPDHNLDPKDLGYIDTDYVHISESGTELLGDQIWDLGLSPIKP